MANRRNANQGYVFITNAVDPKTLSNTMRGRNGDEIKFAMAYFSNKMFTYDEMREFTRKQITMRPTFGIRGGSDTNVESRKRFASLENIGLIRAVK